MSALFWPFSHAGGYMHADILAFLPLALATAEIWRRWPLKILHWLAVLYLGLSLTWETWASWRWLSLVIRGGIRTLLVLPVSQWNQMNAHLAAPLLLGGGFLGWLLFRQCRNYSQAVSLFVLGTVVIVLNKILWNLPAQGPLAAYLAVGLTALAYYHRQRLAVGSTPSPGISRRIAGLWTAILFLPLAGGWVMPSHRASDPFGIWHNDVLPLLQNLGTASTGYGPGVTDIGHSLVPNRQPVFLAKTRHLHYWQAAVYDHFNGTRWSNYGPTGLVYSTMANDIGIPLIPSYFNNVGQASTVNARIIDLTAKPFSTLFYTGLPINFSVATTVHSQADRFAASANQYSLTALEPRYDKSLVQNTGFNTPPPGLSPDLQLPASLSPKVGQLAQQITVDANGPWQAALDIKQYLDAHYQYSYHVTPSHGNVVNHFLFQDRQGYCDQFSTTFIMMMRTLKVPARWVVGYAPGTVNAARHGYLVRAVDAHSWAEIWIDQVGWVPFDPTPGFSFPISYLPHQAPAAKVPATVAPLPKLHQFGGSPIASNTAAPKPVHHIPHALPTVQHAHKQSNRHNQAVWDGIAILAVLLAVAGVMLNRPRRSPIDQAWHNLKAWSARRLDSAEVLSSPRQWGRAWVARYPADADLVWPLVALFDAAFYRSARLSDAEMDQVREAIRKIKQRARRPA